MRTRQVHLDFHTGEHIPGIGAEFNKAQFQEALKVGHVDSITVFSKCHHGWSYHPTKIGYAHPNLKINLLKEQIEAAHEIGVKTPVYISAGFDERYVREHPEHRYETREHTFDNFSEPHYNLICFNTPYLDYLLEQIKEVVETFDADGIFLDITGVRPCCCSHCIKAMLKKGMNPDNPDDILALAEETYANYLKRVRETVDSIKPGLAVFHNEGHIRHARRDIAYSNSHLELESLPTGGWGYDHFPTSARYVQNLGMDFLGMTGKFHTSWGEFGGFKHPNALRYETALSVAHGAKCSVGDQLAPNGRMDMTTYELIGAGYSELEKREEWLDRASPVCDIAVLSLESVLNEAGAQSAGITLTSSDTGASRILLEGKYMFSIIDSDVPLDSYRVVILPDALTLSDKMYKKLKDFTNKGGKILASGSSAVKDGKFMFDFGADFEGESEFMPSYIRPLNSNPHQSDYIMYSPNYRIKLTTGTELAKAVDPYFNRTAEHFCSHIHTPSSGISNGSGITVGKEGAYIAWKIFDDYAKNGELIARNCVINALDTLLSGDKLFSTNLGSFGVATLMKQEDKKRYITHLLYAVPSKRGNGVEVIEDIYPVYDINISVKIPEKVKNVYTAPDRTPVAFTEENGVVTVEGICVNCHQMIVFDIE